MAPKLLEASLNRRQVLAGSGAAALLLTAGALPARAETPMTHTLEAAPGRVALAGPPHPDTAVWCYNGRVPGPEIRVRQGDRVRVRVTNRLSEETTVHWHGIRVPHAMDGVPHLTQSPIAPGDGFLYEFAVPDAGTYWYHSHQHSIEQVGRGLAGPLIVEEPTPIPVDRDITWMLNDWRLTEDAAIQEDFGDRMDLSHGGRIGNAVTVNGAMPDDVAVRAGERIRLRLINAANARIFGLRFHGHQPQVIALDGQPVEPHPPHENRVVLGPGMRVDLVVDMTGAPGDRAPVVDEFYRRDTYRLLDFAYAAAPLREHPLDTPIRLPANPLPIPDPASAERHALLLEGGMMGRLTAALVNGQRTDIRTMLRFGMAWAINGVAAHGHVLEPVVTLRRGRTCILAMTNDTAWHHPMHLHGHTFQVIARNGTPPHVPEWRDTVLLAPGERVDVAFVADNPGDWMFHCHVLEHQEAGMMSVIRVA